MMNTERLQAARSKARELIEHHARLGLLAPELGADKAWLNVARPLTRDDFAGKLVLIEFWTYCCLDCMHVQSELEALQLKYADAPFVVVGVHCAKFANEADPAHVRQALLRERVAHPVVVDRDFDIWTRFAVRAWPTLVLVSPDGCMIGQVSGEGQGAVLDVFIEQALALYAERGALDPRPLPLRAERHAEFARELCFPGKIVADEAARKLYIADSGHDRVVAITFDGEHVATWGDGEPGLVDGPRDRARFRGPHGLALAQGRLLVADTHNHAVRSIDLASGDVTTIAGLGRQGFERSGVFAARSVALDSPWDLCCAGDEVLVAMAGANQVWSLDIRSRTIRSLAGDGTAARRDGAFSGASFAQPSGIVRLHERVFIADSGASAARVLDLDAQTVTTLAGGAADALDLFHFGDEDGRGLGRRFQNPLGIAADASEAPELALLYVADSFNHKLKLLDPHTGAVSVYAGTGAAGFTDGLCEAAQFDEPAGVCIAANKLFVADRNNHAIRVVDLETHVVTTLALRDVAIPRCALTGKFDRSSAGSALPRLASTVVQAPVRAQLAIGSGEIELRLALSAGEQLATNAPSQYRVLHIEGLVAARSVAGPIDSDGVRIPLGVAGSGSLRVQALYYVGDDRNACRMRSSEWTVNIEAGTGQKRRVVLDVGAS